MKLFRQIHYPPETMNIMMMARIIATIQLAEDKAHIYNALMQVSNVICENMIII